MGFSLWWPIPWFPYNTGYSTICTLFSEHPHLCYLGFHFLHFFDGFLEICIIEVDFQGFCYVLASGFLVGFVFVGGSCVFCCGSKSWRKWKRQIKELWSAAIGY